MLRAIDSGKSDGGSSGRHWVLDPIDGTKGYLSELGLVTQVVVLIMYLMLFFDVEALICLQEGSCYSHLVICLSRIIRGSFRNPWKLISQGHNLFESCIDWVGVWKDVGRGEQLMAHTHLHLGIFYFILFYKSN